MRQNRLRSPRTRAVTEEAKSVRRASLLSAAGRLFVSRDFDGISVGEIARKAGLAKGTVYLYFGTKEALFLELVAEQLEAWVHEAGPALVQLKSGPVAVAAAVASTLSQRPILVRLLALLHSVLERNTEVAPLRDFKKRLLQVTTKSGALFEQALALAPGTGVRLTLWMHATIVGLAQMTAISPTLAEVLAQDNSLAILRLDFRTELEVALATLFAGATGGASKRRSRS
ncbi:MAG TPA: TetR family transcriptional regulator [Acidobacteriaceae bacterium]